MYFIYKLDNDIRSSENITLNDHDITLFIPRVELKNSRLSRYIYSQILLQLNC